MKRSIKRYKILLGLFLFSCSAFAAIDTNDEAQVFAQQLVDQGPGYIERFTPTTLGIDYYKMYELSEDDGGGNIDTDAYRLQDAGDGGFLCPDCDETEMRWDPNFPDQCTCVSCSTVISTDAFPESEVQTLQHWEGGTVNVSYFLRPDGQKVYVTGMTDAFKFYYMKRIAEYTAYTYEETGDERFAEACRTAFMTYIPEIQSWPCVSNSGYEDCDFTSSNQSIWPNQHWGYPFRFIETRTLSWAFFQVKDSAAFSSLINGESYKDHINEQFFGYLAKFMMAYPVQFSVMNNLGQAPQFMTGLALDHDRPEAAHFIHRYTNTDMFYGYQTSYDGMSIEGPSYHNLWFDSSVYRTLALIGYQEPDGYVDAMDGTSFSGPVELEDLYHPFSQRAFSLKQSSERINLPNGTMAGVHDNRNTAKEGTHTTECRSRILPGFGHLTFGDGMRGQQVQTQFHFSNWGGHSANDSLTYQLYAHERPLFEFSGHQDYFRTTVNKNAVVVNHRSQERNPSRGLMEFYTPLAPGVKMARVEADYISFGSTQTKRYCRTIIQNTSDIERPYVLDIFDVHGGDIHEYLLGGSMFYEQTATANIPLMDVGEAYPYGEGDWQYYHTASSATITENTYVDFTFDDGHEGAARIHLAGHVGDELLLSRLSKKPNVYLEVDQVAHRPHLMIRRGNAEVTTDNLDSCFVTVHEAYKGQPFIESVTRHQLSADTLAVVVELSDRTDTYLIALNEAQTMVFGDYRANAMVAAFSEAKTGTGTDIWMAGGTLASTSNRALVTESGKISGDILEVRRTLNGDVADGFVLDMDLPVGMELRGQMLYIDGFDDAGARQVVNAFEISEIQAGPSNGQCLVLTRQDSGALLLNGGGVEFLYYPYGTYADCQARFISSCSSVPHFAYIEQEKDRWDVESLQPVAPGFTDGTLHPEITTLPLNTPIIYNSNGGTSDIPFAANTVITDDMEATYRLANVGGVMQDQAQTEVYAKSPAGIHATVQTAGVTLKDGEIASNLSRIGLADAGTSQEISTWLYVPQDGMYTFYQYASGGSSTLDISGHRVIDVWGATLAPMPGKIHLHEGWHPLECSYWDATYARFLKWSGPGFDYQDIPAANLAAELTDISSDFKLTYLAATGGTIRGATTQHLSSGADSQAVFAMPDAGYRFTGWSDGTSSPLHQQFNLHADTSITAQFETDANNLGFTLETWEGIGGNEIVDLTGHANFPDNPTRTESISTIDLEDVGQSNYGRRITGLIRAPISGDYLFQITADDTAELWLSSDATEANKVKIAELSAWAGSDDYTKFASQTSAPIPLEAGHAYYLEVLQKEAGGGDHVSVRLQMPGDGEPVVLNAALATVNVEVEVPSYPAFTVQYQANPAHGTIIGAAIQGLEKYQQATEVTAVPAAGYRFIGWSDHVRSARRQDQVLADTTYTAFFEALPLTLSYSATANGSLAGPLMQLLPPGERSATVTAVPDPGHHFTGWSDGLTTAARNDIAISNQTVTASFEMNDGSIDSDGDGLSDVEELLTYGTHPDLVDTDYDGITDYWEIQAGTDPADPESRLEIDSDGDGLLDWDEIEYGTDPADADSDGDSLTDFEEIHAGLDPLGANSVKSMPGLLAYYSLNEQQGPLALDHSGNGNHASITAPAFTTYDDRQVFSITSADIRVPAHVGESISNELTIAFWIKGDEGLSSNSLIDHKPEGTRVLNIHLPWGDTVYFDAGNITDGYDRISTSIPADHAETLHHWAFVKNATTGEMTIYLDGEVVSSSTGKTKPMTDFAELLFGYSYKGVIDDLCIFNKALDPSAIQMLFSGVDPDSDGLTYYIDSVAGSDSNKGTDISTPWKTLAAVNAITLGPDDSVLFKANSVFTGQLKLQGSGASGAPIIVDMYGVGNKPRIDGEGNPDFEATVLLENVEYIEVSNLEITNQGAYTTAVKRRGLVVAAKNIGTLHHIHLKNLDIHDVNGSLLKKTNEGVALLLQCEGPAQSNFDDILIEGCHIWTCDRNGIDIKSDFYQSDSYDAVNKKRVGGNWFPSTNVIIRNNLLEDIGGDVIKIISCDGAIVEHNIARYGVQRCSDPAAGIWTWSADNCIIQYNESCYMKNNQDGQGFDSDDNCVGNIFQYNYSHDNGGGFFLIIGVQPDIEPGSIGVRDTIIRYNVSQNDGESGKYVFHISSGGTYDTYIYNNTIYCKSDRNVDLFKIGTWTGIPLGHTYVKNNIFYADGTFDNDFASYSSFTFDSNVFYGTHLNAQMGANYLTSDPLLFNAGGGTDGFDSLIAYIPASNSSAVNSGLVIADNGGLDVRGKTVPYGGAPDRGACEYSAELVAVPDHYQVAMNQTLTVVAPGVLGNDMGESSLTAELVDSASQGAVTLNADGSFTYIPNVDVTGDDTFTYKVISGVTSSDVATVTVNVFGPSIEPNLIAHWMFDETAGITASDSSGHGNDGTLSGGSWVTGKIGGAVELTSADIVEINGTQVTGDWTAAVWVYTSTGVSSGGHEDLLRSDTSNIALFNWETGSVAYGHPGVDDWEFGYTVPTDTWVHLTFVGDGTATVKLYVDGVYQASVTANMASSCPMDTIGLNMDAALDDLRIYGQALSPAEIEDLYMNIDTDGDGLTDAQELALGTNPNDPNSGFGIAGKPLPISGKIELTWPSATGVLYRVWKSPNLTSWSVARDWTNAVAIPVDALELDLTPSNGFFWVEAEIQ
ncbi:PA14 domain-containing protein [Pontiellaceae bacterium B12227]|nr:PA14 domain-containing protein [Pontiellaceae bacterium B12227]